MLRAMTNSRPERISLPLAEALHAIAPLPDRLAAAVRPRSGSLAESDQRQRVGRYTLELSSAALNIGIEHLVAWRALALGAGFLPAYTFLTLLRTAIECSAFARWLLDPGLDRDTRRRRGIGAQLADYDERRKWEAAAGVRPDPPGKPAKQRMADLEAEARRLGLKPIRPLNRVVLAARYVLEDGAQDKVGEMLYRVLSGAAHGKQWTVLQAVREITDDMWARTTIDQGLAASATMVAVVVARDSIDDLERYNGPLAAQDGRPSSG